MSSPRIAAAQYNVEPRQGRDGTARADADGTRVERIEFPGYKPFALAVAIARKGADGVFSS